MRRIYSVLPMIMLVLFSYNPCLAQSTNVHAKMSIIDPSQLQVTTNKTTNLIFPYSIKSVDRGSADLLVQQAKSVDNILQVKAAKENFAETNLTVITSDGNLYSFIVNYDRQPSMLTIRISADTLAVRGHPDQLASLPASEEGVTEASIISTANQLLHNKKRTVFGVKDKSYNMKLRLEGIFVQGDIMYYQLRCSNSSNINYDVEMLRFYLRDQKRSKRTATQELEIKPLYVAGNTTRIKGKSKQVCVVALSKFTIPDAKYLAIEMKEKNGGRNLLLKAQNRSIIRASIIKVL